MAKSGDIYAKAFIPKKFLDNTFKLLFCHLVRRSTAGIYQINAIEFIGFMLLIYNSTNLVSINFSVNNFIHNCICKR